METTVVQENFKFIYLFLLSIITLSCLYMTTSLIKVPSQKIPVPKITMQTKSHNLNFNVLSSVVDTSGDEYHLILIIISMPKHGLSKKSTHFCPYIFNEGFVCP